MMLNANRMGAIAAVTASLAFMTSALAATFDCNGLAADLGPTEVGRVYVYQAETGGWQPLASRNSFATNTVARLLYVTRESYEPSRAGTLVIKTGRYLVDEPQIRRPMNVALRRPKGEFTGEFCVADGTSDGYDGAVSATSYDRYHDTDNRLDTDDDRKSLDAFHIRYVARRQQCRNTNDPTPDSLIALDFRSNRTQFSFDPVIVANGTPSVVAQSFFAKAAAAKTPMSEQSVTIRRYHLATGTGQAACVPFEQRVTGKGSFVRFNDLEARTRGFLGGLYRVSEQAFILQQ